MNPSSTTALDVAAIRQEFPILQQTIHRDRPLIYFDSGASTQRPRCVIEAMNRFYETDYANVHRGIHFLSEQASAQYETARKSVQRFINAKHDVEVIFTSGTTASINLIAHGWGNQNVKQGDEILLTIFEHHSNIVPWQQLAARTGATVKFAQIDSDGNLDMDDFRAKLSARTKVVSFASVSNVLGTETPVKEIVKATHSVGAVAVVDAAQSVPHGATDVQDWGADFVAFSAHKMVGPSGIGILWGKRELLEAMSPFHGGGSMIDQVTTDGFTPGELPAKFEAGTPPITEAIGLNAAIEYLESVSIDAIAAHEKQLVTEAYRQLEAIEGLTILGPGPDHRGGLVSFVVEKVSPQDLSILLDQKGVAIRAGHHCAMPLHKQLGIRSSCRASFYLYNSLDEVSQFTELLTQVIDRLR